MMLSASHSKQKNQCAKVVKYAYSILGLQIGGHTFALTNFTSAKRMLT